MDGKFFGATQERLCCIKIMQAFIHHFDIIRDAGDFFKRSIKGFCMETECGYAKHEYLICRNAS
jgi:hypothetical protein